WIRDRHVSTDKPRPAERAGLRERARLRRREGGDDRGPAGRARGDPAGDLEPAPPQADAGAAVRLRRVGRAGRPADEDDAGVSSNGKRSEIEIATDAIVAELAEGERFLITTHEGPDGDALGSTLALQEALTQLGKDSLMFLAEKEFPLPIEYRFLPLQEVFHEAPADLADRTVIFLDCGNIDRMPVQWLRDGKRILNLDHHHDNTRFADVNLVDVDASSTA